MAKKSNTSKKEKKTPADYKPFIKTTLYWIVKENIPYIKDVCENYSGIEPLPLDDWKKLDNIVIKVGKAAEESNVTAATKWKTEPSKRIQYTITHKVREKERKNFILRHIEMLSEDEDNNIHRCYLIYQHLRSLITESSK